MCNDARERNQWKVRLVNWTDTVKTDVSKPVLKLMNEGVFVCSPSVHDKKTIN